MFVRDPSKPSGFRFVLRTIITLLFLSTGSSIHATALDGGVEPANLGKGDWIYFLSTAVNHVGGTVPGVYDLPSLMSFYRSEGVQFLVVKAGTGAADFNGGFNAPQFDSNLVYQAHATGIRIFGYTRSLGQDVPGEIRLADRVYGLGADGFVLDAEVEWESDSPWIGTNGPALAVRLCSGIKSRWPRKFLAHSPLPVIGLHTSFPYREFGMYCDAIMPQAYWRDLKQTPTTAVEWMDYEWNMFYAELGGIYTNAIKPLAPVGQADDRRITSAQINEFFDCLRTDRHSLPPGGYHGCSFWRADLHPAGAWNAIASHSVSRPSTNPPVIWNLAATDLTDSSAIVRWVTDIASDTVVDFGYSDSYGGSVTNSTPDCFHAILLSGLIPNLRYHCRVHSRGAATEATVSADFTFVTRAEGRVDDIIIDDPEATVAGAWSVASSAAGRFGSGYHYKTRGCGTNWLEYTPDIRVAGDYQVYECHPSGKNRTTAASYVITSNGNTHTILVNQSVGGGRWNLLGTFPFAAGFSGSVRITDQFSGLANQIVVADAVKFVYVQPASPPEASPLFPGKIFQVSLQGDSPTNRTAETSNTWAIWPPPTLPFATNSAPLPGPDETNHPAYELRLEP